MSNLLETVKELYPKSDISSVELVDNILKMTDNGEVRLYEIRNSKLYFYRPTLVSGDNHIEKFKTIFREAKIDKIIE